jgi:hypothetical protein
MVSGRSFDIRHPEMACVGNQDIIIFKFVNQTPEVYDHWDNVGLSLIESISHLAPSVA